MKWIYTAHLVQSKFLKATRCQIRFEKTSFTPFVKPKIFTYSVGQCCTAVLLWSFSNVLLRKKNFTWLSIGRGVSACIMIEFSSFGDLPIQKKKKKTHRHIAGFSTSYMPQRSHVLYTFSPHCHPALFIGCQSGKPNHIATLYHTQW